MVAFVTAVLIGVALDPPRDPRVQASPTGHAPHLGRGDGRGHVRLLPHVLDLRHDPAPLADLDLQRAGLDARQGCALGPGGILKNQKNGGWFPLTLNYQIAPRPPRGGHLRGRPRLPDLDLRLVAEPGQAGRRACRPSPRPTTGARWCARADMARTDANPPMPEFRDDYVLQEVDAAWLSKAVKPKQFIHIDQSECITCEGCVDICPWKCIHLVKTEAIDEAILTELPGRGPRRPLGVPHRRRRVHPLRPVRRPLPDRRDHPGQGRRPLARPATSTSARPPTATATGCGSDERADSRVPKRN